MSTRNERYQKRAAGVVFVLLAAMLCALAGRVIHINTSMAARLGRIATAQHQSASIIPARRGLIVDACGRVLAGSELRDSVFADPGLIEHPTELAAVLEPILGSKAAVIERTIRTSRAPRFCWLKRRIDETAADALHRKKLTGIGLCNEFQRLWPMHETAAHVVGFAGSDGQGLAGIELVCDSHLRGEDGRRSILRDARRRVIGPGRSGDVPPVDGGHVVLTIDSVIQRIAERELAEQIEAFEAQSGVAIVMSPGTGDVLAMAGVPTFDPNRYGQFDKGAWRNRAVADPVEPGSTFKSFVMAGALDGGHLKLDERIDCHNGVHYFGRRRIRDTSPHGLLTPREIVVQSSNIGMGITGMRMGNTALREIVTRFGFGERTQIGLPGESRGIVLPVRRWSSYSTTSVPMGQELAITPIQLVTGFCAVVNGGTLLRPRVIKAKLAADGSVVESFDTPEVIRRVIPDALARYLAEDVLVGVVDRGGAALDLAGYRMCGKTGTAQVPYKDQRGYEPRAYLSSFVGAAPVGEPALAVLVMIHKPNPDIGYYGRVVAGPAVRDIMAAALRYLEVPTGFELADASVW